MVHQWSYQVPTTHEVIPTFGVDVVVVEYGLYEAHGIVGVHVGDHLCKYKSIAGIYDMAVNMQCNLLLSHHSIGDGL